MAKQDNSNYEGELYPDELGLFKEDCRDLALLAVAEIDLYHNEARDTTLVMLSISEEADQTSKKQFGELVRMWSHKVYVVQ